MEKWYVVDDGEIYNVLPESEFIDGGYDKDQVVKVTNNMDYAFNYAERLNREVEEKSNNFHPLKGYYNECVKITENDLRKMVEESIKRILNK